MPLSHVKVVYILVDAVEMLLNNRTTQSLNYLKYHFTAHRLLNILCV